MYIWAAHKTFRSACFYFEGFLLKDLEYDISLNIEQASHNI